MNVTEKVLSSNQPSSMGLLGSSEVSGVDHAIAVVGVFKRAFKNFPRFSIRHITVVVETLSYYIHGRKPWSQHLVAIEESLDGIYAYHPTHVGETSSLLLCPSKAFNQSSLRMLNVQYSE